MTEGRLTDISSFLCWIAILRTPSISQMRTCTAGDSTAPPPPSPPPGGATTVGSLPTTSELPEVIPTHPAGKGKWCPLTLY